jgi:hypothetical protein
LETINSQLAFFAQGWNRHRIQIRHGPNRSPADMFGFDMIVHGVRGSQLPEDVPMSDEELEVYGVDWEGLQDIRLLQSQQQNNDPQEGGLSWIGRVGPPPHLNEVLVESPSVQLPVSVVELLEDYLQQQTGNAPLDLIQTWVYSLIFMRSVYGDDF